MACKHRIVYCGTFKMTKYCIVKKFTNNSSCKNVSFFKKPKHCAWLDLLRLGNSTMYLLKPFYKTEFTVLFNLKCFNV